MKEYVAPSIKVINNAIDFSQDIIDLALSAPNEAWRNSSVQDDHPESGYNPAVRSSSEIGITHGLDKPIEFFKLSQAIYLEARQYAKENGFMFSHMENVNLLRYPVGEGFFDRHYDAGVHQPRSMSALLYLNDVEEGGGTWFDKFELMVKPEAGKLVLFPANYPYSHQAMPPISNTKFVVVTWFGEKIDPSVFERYYP